MNGEQIVLLVLGFGLGAGLMAIVYETARWDIERRRLAADLAAAAAVPVFGDAAPDPGHVLAQEPPAGRHRRGPNTLDLMGSAFAAGQAAAAGVPVPADPYSAGCRPPRLEPLPVFDMPVYRETWAPQGAGAGHQVNGWSFA